MRRRSIRTTPRSALGVALLALGLGVSTPVRAQPQQRAHQLRYDVPLDATVIGLSAAFVIGTELFKVVKPHSCRWCDRDEERDTLNGLDRWGRSSFRWR